MKKKIILFSVLLLLLIGLIIVGFVFKDQKKAANKSIVLVKTQPVESKDVPHIILAVGALVASEQINIGAESNGFVKQISFRGGQQVKHGDILLTLDNVKAKADVLSSCADYRTAKLKYERSLELQKKGFVSKQTIDLVYSNMQNALAQKQEAEDILNKKTIRAPFSGYLGKRRISVGDYITSGQKLVSLVNRKQLKINYSVPEQYLNFLKLGQLVQITVDSMPNKHLSGIVSFISPTTDSQTHTVALQTTIPNPKNLLEPGLFVTIKQTIDESRPALLVPEQSVVKTLQSATVFKVLNGKARAVAVKTGDLINGDIVILSGLSKKDIIVTKGQHQLHNGDFVKEVGSKNNKQIVHAPT
jgi:RND family efflux transporter MFP subunit